MIKEDKRMKVGLSFFVFDKINFEKKVKKIDISSRKIQ